jgi:hypothetical protein
MPLEVIVGFVHLKKTFSHFSLTYAFEKKCIKREEKKLFYTINLFYFEINIL